MKTKNHKILDHPVLGYFLLMIFVLIMASIFSKIIDSMILGNIIPGYAVKTEAFGREMSEASGVGMAVGSIAAIGIGDYVTIAAGVVGLVIGLYLIRPAKRAEIVRLWQDKWKA